LPEASIDVLFSNLCIQWIDDLPALFAEFRRVLRPGGYLAFSTFGPDTLHELRAAWAAADSTPHVSAFAHIGQVGDALIAAGFRDPVLDTEHFTLRYTVAADLMRELKAIGATNADAQRARGLTGKAHFRRALDAYEGYRQDGSLPATYEVICAHAFAPDSGQPRRLAGAEIATFSVDALRGSRR
jgi:malonyl-CoA O-methyltransferase